MWSILVMSRYWNQNRTGCVILLSVLLNLTYDELTLNADHRSFYTGVGIHNLLDDGTLGPEMEIHGLPDGAKINFVTW